MFVKRRVSGLMSLLPHVAPEAAAATARDPHQPPTKSRFPTTTPLCRRIAYAVVQWK
jgi:hypothetical protein